ncbi:hypothetical protein GOODEAATRI_006195, partial [Goodea atripinnis]
SSLMSQIKEERKQSLIYIPPPGTWGRRHEVWLIHGSRDGRKAKWRMSLSPSGLPGGVRNIVPVRGAQWGPVEDTKGGLLQLPVTLRPIQQLFGVYTGVLNPRTQPSHKGTSLASAQRSPLLAPS